MNKNTISILIVILVIIVGYSLLSKGSKKAEVLNVDTLTEESSVMIEENNELAAEIESDIMLKAGSYELYTPEKLAKAEEGDVVLFFKAAWCPTCRTLDKDIKANLNAIPEGVAILEVDYDNSNELKKKYGVTYQHTLVQVDKDGNMIKKWMGSKNLTILLGEVN